MNNTKRWGLALKKNVQASPTANKHNYGWQYTVAKTFRKFTSRDEARLAAEMWPNPVYIVDTQLQRVVR